MVAMGIMDTGKTVTQIAPLYPVVSIDLHANALTRELWTEHADAQWQRVVKSSKYCTFHVRMLLLSLHF